MENKEVKQINQSNPKVMATPASVLANMYMSRTGKILSNLTFLCILWFVLSFITPIVSMVFYAVVFCLVIASVVFTLGSVFLFNPGFVPSLFELMKNGGEKLVEVTEFMYKANPYVIGACAGLSLLSILLLSLNKHDKSVWRIVFSSILLAVSVIILLILLFGGKA